MNSPRQYPSVDAALASLPAEIAPPRDLWPAIARTTGHARPRPWPVALAASLALFTLVGALSWSVWQRPPAQLAVAPAAGRALGYELPQDAAYVATRAALEHTFAERLPLLAPATRARVQQDLELVRRANADIRDALRSDPASPLLLLLLRSTWQQEFNLYTTVTHSTDTLLTRRS
jgi:hypothetical protein